MLEDSPYRKQHNMLFPGIYTLHHHREYLSPIGSIHTADREANRGAQPRGIAYTSHCSELTEYSSRKYLVDGRPGGGVHAIRVEEWAERVWGEVLEFIRSARM